MLDIELIRKNKDKIKKACINKQVKVDIDYLLKVDEKRRKLIAQLGSLEAERNKISRSKSISKKEIELASRTKKEIKKIEPELKEVQVEFKNLLNRIPNIPFDDVPIGKDDSGNIVIKKWGKIPKFSFPAKEHFELGEKLDIIDVKRAAKIAGTRFAYLKNQGVLLELALINFSFDVLVKKGFIPVIPPIMMKEETAKGTGYFEAVDKEEAYFIPKDNLFLAGTSEQPVVAMHQGEIFKEKELPKRYVAFSSCFRREAGSYGKDTKGILRVHQFDKVEMVIFSKPKDSEKEHLLLLSIEEELMQKLELPYRVVNICTGDLGLPAAKKFDIEAFLPGQKRYRETHSTSNCTDFQARRLNIKYRKEKNNKAEFVHTLNGTALAIGRTLIAIIENYQQKDGSIKVPKVLQRYLDFKEITANNKQQF